MQFFSVSLCRRFHRRSRSHRNKRGCVHVLCCDFFSTRFCREWTTCPRKIAVTCVTVRSIKPAIHYSQTWRIGDEISFSPNKILLAKTRRTCCCTLFVVCHQFSAQMIFFRQKATLCSSTRPLPQRKSCLQCTAKKLFAKHGERLLYTICRTLFFRQKNRLLRKNWRQTTNIVQQHVRLVFAHNILFGAKMISSPIHHVCE